MILMGGGSRGIAAGVWNAGFMFSIMRCSYLIGEGYRAHGSLRELVVRAVIVGTVLGLIWIVGHKAIREML